MLVASQVKPTSVCFSAQLHLPEKLDSVLLLGFHWIQPTLSLKPLWCLSSTTVEKEKRAIRKKYTRQQYVQIHHMDLYN